MSLISLGDGSTLTLDFTTGVLDPRLTFTRASGGTYTGNDGLVYGMDFATSSSLAIGTGSKSVTLTATAGVDRRYLVGQTVYISNGVNNMSGPVTAYNASTQVLTINATATSGSGSFTSWTVGNASARFDHDPTTLAPRGLLIEATAINYMLESTSLSGYSNTNMVAVSSGSETDPEGNANSAKQIYATSGALAYHGFFRSTTAGTNTQLTISIWAKARNYTFLFLSDLATGRAAVRFNLQTGAVDNNFGAGYVSARATPYTNGWWRCEMVVTVTASTAYAWAFGGTPSGATLNAFGTQYAGTGNAADGIYCYGFQVEGGSGASSYIPTGASQGTRNADNCYIYDTTSSGGLSWFKTATQGTFYVEMFKRTAGTAFAAAGFGTRATAFQEFMLYQAVGNNWLSFNWGAGEYTTNYSALSSPFLIKAAVALSPSTPTTEADSTVSINGSNSALNTGPNIALPFTSDLFCIGSRGPASGTAPSQNYAETAIRRIKFFPFAMTAAQMNAITTL